MYLTRPLLIQLSAYCLSLFLLFIFPSLIIPPISLSPPSPTPSILPLLPLHLLFFLCFALILCDIWIAVSMHLIVNLNFVSPFRFISDNFYKKNENRIKTVTFLNGTISFLSSACRITVRLCDKRWRLQSYVYIPALLSWQSSRTYVVYILAGFRQHAMQLQSHVIHLHGTLRLCWISYTHRHTSVYSCLCMQHT